MTSSVPPPNTDRNFDAIAALSAEALLETADVGVQEEIDGVCAGARTEVMDLVPSDADFDDDAVTDVLHAADIFKDEPLLTLRSPPPPAFPDDCPTEVMSPLHTKDTASAGDAWDDKTEPGGGHHDQIEE
jgi:hypothetical protein